MRQTYSEQSSEGLYTSLQRNLQKRLHGSLNKNLRKKAQSDIQRFFKNQNNAKSVCARLCTLAQGGLLPQHVGTFSETANCPPRTQLDLYLNVPALFAVTPTYVDFAACPYGKLPVKGGHPRQKRIRSNQPTKQPSKREICQIDRGEGSKGGGEGEGSTSCQVYNDEGRKVCRKVCRKV